MIRQDLKDACLGRLCVWGDIEKKLQLWILAPLRDDLMDTLTAILRSLRARVVFGLFYRLTYP